MNQNINWNNLENLIQDIYKNLNEYNFDEILNIKEILYLVFLIEYEYIEKYSERLTNIRWNTNLNLSILELIKKIIEKNPFKTLKILQNHNNFIFTYDIIYERNIKKCISTKEQDKEIIFKREYISKPNLNNIKTDLITIEIIDKTLLKVIFYGSKIIMNLPQKKYPFNLKSEYSFDIDFINFVKKNKENYLGQIKKVPKNYRTKRKTKKEMLEYNKNYL
jgi:hypothetical protein